MLAYILSLILSVPKGDPSMLQLVPQRVGVVWGDAVVAIVMLA